jgi:hypothetical protein
VAAAWLLVATMLVGPMGIGVSVASAEPCGASCPCDDVHASDDGHRPTHDDGDQHSSESDHHDEAPVDDDCPDDCPDNCPDCGCCSGVVLAMVAWTAPSVAATSYSLAVPPQPRAPAIGAFFNVYRPPRSLN